ncbi:LuxR C-terminal-related transcriptional regulator [Methylomonas montana]|uniref:response regulator transcription factor n=1 Tax=Methylomonas montana TaxID=3058963 RepID=UPI002657CF6C|nr:LuxR C-terminal-related transcriptional regulator [Methylomonas montana]WKJ88776.1 LuxR C-terminal-related transcriptional regulator [Methylomonas montana]
METPAVYRVPSIQVAGMPALPTAHRRGLTEREFEVLQLLCQAMPDKVMARRLNVSAKTISMHLEHIYSKLGIHSDSQNARCAAILAAFDLGLVQPPSCH